MIKRPFGTAPFFMSTPPVPPCPFAWFIKKIPLKCKGGTPRLPGECFPFARGMLPVCFRIFASYKHINSIITLS